MGHKGKSSPLLGEVYHKPHKFLVINRRWSSGWHDSFRSGLFHIGIESQTQAALTVSAFLQGYSQSILYTTVLDPAFVMEQLSLKMPFALIFYNLKNNFMFRSWVRALASWNKGGKMGLPGELCRGVLWSPWCKPGFLTPATSTELRKSRPESNLPLSKSRRSYATFQRWHLSHLHGSSSLLSSSLVWSWPSLPVSWALCVSAYRKLQPILKLFCRSTEPKQTGESRG